MTKFLALALAVAVAAFGAIGDNAPSIPASYVVTHPRLPYPDNAFLDTIWTARAGGAAFIWTDASAWDSTAPGSRVKMRHLLLAYLAEKRNGGPNVAAFLAKIQGFADLNGNWNLNNGSWDPTFALALSYDWCYADLGSTVQASIRSSLYTMMSNFEAVYVSSKSSPFNDQFYVTGTRQMLHLLAALAVYPDDATNSMPHLRWSLDVHVNMLWPAWKTVMCGDPCVASTGDSDTSHGGAWHEAWGDYVNKTEGLTEWYLTETLAWAVASGRGVSNYFTVDNPWMRNFAYWTMYAARPDFTLEPIEPMGRPYFDGENFSSSGNPAAIGQDPGMLDGVAAIYNDPTIRGWARFVNWYGNTPNGYVPSAWPYFTPDASGNSANTRASLSKVRYFPGRETLYFRTGWGEDDTFCVFRVGSNFWSHPVADAGAINCFNRGPLTIRSGDYRPGSASDHFYLYALRAISQNTFLVYDPADIYASETWVIDRSDGSTTNTAAPNDGGQRGVGSAVSNIGAIGLHAITASPADPAQLMRGREFYHQGKAVAYATSAKYTFIAADITAAYNNLWSRNAHTVSWAHSEANTSNRTYRVQKAVRQVTFIPRGTAAYVITYDQIVSTNAGFVKKILWHSINAPSISGNAYTITRADLVTSKPFVDHWPQQWSSGHVGSGGITHCPTACTTSSTQYQYGGKLYGWLTLPSGGVLTTVGGAGHEFDITDANGTVNHNECMQSQCGVGEGLGPATGADAGLIEPEPLAAPHQPGSYRIEQTVGASNLADQFINVQLVTSSSDTNVVSTAPVTSVSGTNYVTVWKDAGDTCTYTLTQPINGIGGTLTATGAGCATVI